LDDQLYPENTEKSAVASLILGSCGMAASQGLVEKSEQFANKLKKTTNCSNTRALQLKLARFGALYSIALSCVLVWRGTWMMWDVVYEKVTNEKPTSPMHATHSGVLSHSLAAVCLLGGGFFASVLAPPAAASVISDLAVKAGQRHYAGPAARVAKQFLGNEAKPAVLSSTRAMHSAQQRRTSVFPRNKQFY
jgi:hypothetical protein